MKEQILAVANADIVAGCSSSGLYLSGFMKTGSRVILLESQRQIALEAINDTMGINLIRLQICTTRQEDNKIVFDIDKLIASLNAQNI